MLTLAAKTGKPARQLLPPVEPDPKHSKKVHQAKAGAAPAASSAPALPQGPPAQKTGNDGSQAHSDGGNIGKGLALRMDCVEKLAVQLDSRLRVVESSSLFVLLPKSHPVAEQTLGAVTAYIAAAKASPKEHGQGAPEQVVAKAAIQSIVEMDPPDDPELKLKFVSFSKLALMARIAPEEVCMWVPQAYCAEAYARPGAQKKTKLSLMMRGWVECGANLEAEIDTVKKMEAAVVEYTKEGASPEHKLAAASAFNLLSPMTPLQLSSSHSAGATLVDVQYLTQVVLMALGAEHRAGKAPPGDAALKANRTRGKRGGKKEEFHDATDDR